MTTKQDVTINFRNYGEITVPKGTKLTHFTACGYDPKYHFVAEFGWIKENYSDIAAILIMDAANYGIDIPLINVEFTEVVKVRTVTYEGKQTEVIDVTPTWSGMLHSLVAVIQDGNAEGKKLAMDELKRMAELADRYVAIHNKVN